MSSLEKFNFEGHRNKCRCCLRGFDDEDDFQIKVTKSVQNRFLELTQLALELSDSYSTVICEQCCNKLRDFSLWRNDLLGKQLSLREFVEDLRIAKGRLDLSDQNGEETVIELDDTADSVQLKVEAEEYVFNGSTAINEQSSTSSRAQAEARIREKFRNPESDVNRGQSTSQMSLSVQVSSESKAELSQHEFVAGLEDHPVVKTKEPEPLKRRTPAKRQELQLPGRPAKSGGKKIKCKVCGKTLKNKYNFRNHCEAVHLHNKRFECDFCGRKVFQKWQLKEHLRRHIEGKRLNSALIDLNCFDNTRPFPCKVKGCERFFKTKWELQQHLIAHSDVRPYECHCGKAFKFAYALKAHQNNIHSKK